MTYERFTMQAVVSAAASEVGASVLAREGDPSKDFMTVGRRELDRKTFGASVKRMRKAKGDEVVVFVHGYNYSYQAAVFRLAQLAEE